MGFDHLYRPRMGKLEPFLSNPRACRNAAGADVRGKHQGLNSYYAKNTLEFIQYNEENIERHFAKREG
jgi:hypothetical protein